MAKDYEFVERMTEVAVRDYVNAKLEQLRDAIYNYQCELRDNTVADSKASRRAARELHEAMGEIRTLNSILADKMKARQEREAAEKSAAKRKPALLSHAEAAAIRNKRGCDMAQYREGKTCVESGQPRCTGCTEDAINLAIAEFPAEFGLRAFPGDVFKISRTASYFSGDTLYLYTVVKRGAEWHSFCKGTASELRAQIVAGGAR